VRRLSRAAGCFLACAVLTDFGAPAMLVAQTPVKRVLIIHGGSTVFPGNFTFDAAIRESLFSRPGTPVEAYSEYLENEEFADAADAALAESIRVKFRAYPLDLVIANTAPTLQFVLRHRDDLFPGVPLVFAAATVPPSVLKGEVPRVTGIVREQSQVETIDLALKLHPATKRLHVIAYAPAVAGLRERIAATLVPFSKRATVTYGDEPTLAGMLATVRALPADSLIFYVRYSPVAKGRVIYPQEMLLEIVRAASVPIYSSLDSYLGTGVVGGMTRSGEATGERLGQIALDVLDGAAPERFPIESAQITPMFDWRQLRRWRIDESLLPAGSVIRFRVPTVWDLYGRYILATFVVVAAQLLLIAGLLQSRARLRRADLTIRRSYQRIRRMAGRLINAEEAARAEIARDLHDDVCQKLSSVSIGVGSLKSATGRLDDPRMQEGIAELDRETRDAFESIRRLSHDLHPATLRVLGLAPALRSHCQEVAKRHGSRIEYVGAPGVGAVHPEVAVCFFRIAQESLRNSVAHGGATHMTVTLTREGDALDLAVVDDGRGFDVVAVRNNGGGLGLVAMEERVNLVGGDLSIVSVPGRGTTVRLRGPVNPQA
jgi:signal transduction histidine kinase